MSEKIDLWDDFDLGEETFEENKAVEIIRQQAKLLEKKTQGYVKASFKKIDYKTSTKEVLSKITEVISGVPSIEMPDSDLQDKKDVRDWYANVKYKFEIYSDTYHFRVFTLNNREMFPISMNLDEGIKEEFLNLNVEKINSNDELRSVLTSIFSSTKLKKIITRLVNQAKNSNA